MDDEGLVALPKARRRRRVSRALHACGYGLLHQESTAAPDARGDLIITFGVERYR